MFDWIGNIFSDWLKGLIDFIGDLGIDDIASALFGIVPRSIMFLRSLFLPIYRIIEGVFPSITDIIGVNGTAFCFFGVITFIVILGFRRAVTN